METVRAASAQQNISAHRTQETDGRVLVILVIGMEQANSTRCLGSYYPDPYPDPLVSLAHNLRIV